MHTPDPAQHHTPAVPAWIADRGALDSPHTDAAWRQHLSERYDYLAVRLAERGASLTATPPAWADQLGAVPAEPARREQWTRLVTEVSVFRERYHVPEDAPQAIPEQYRARQVGAELAARVTAMHKPQALRNPAPRAGSHKPVLQRDPARVVARQAAKAAELERMRRSGMIGGGSIHPDKAGDGRDQDHHEREQQDRQRQSIERTTQARRESERDTGREL